MRGLDPLSAMVLLATMSDAARRKGKLKTGPPAPQDIVEVVKDSRGIEYVKNNKTGQLTRLHPKEKKHAK